MQIFSLKQSIWALVSLVFLTTVHAKPSNFETSWHSVPFTHFFDQEKALELFFYPKNLSFKLSYSQKESLQLPDQHLPLKFVRLNENTAFIFARHLFDGKNALFLVDSKGDLQTIELPSTLDEFLFVQAEATEHEVVMIYYNVASCENFLYRIKRGGKGWIFDPLFTRELQFGTNHISDHVLNVHSFQTYDPSYDNKWVYFMAGNTCYTYHNIVRPTISKISLPENFDLIQVKQHGTNFIGLYKDLSLEKELLTTQKPLYSLFNVLTLEAIPTPQGKIPLLQKEESNYTFVDAQTLSKMAPEILETDLHHAEPSGIMNLGVSNYEGLIPWSQVYYLNGFINLLQSWPNLSVQQDPNLKKLQEKVRQRLDIEIYLLDHLLLSQNPGFVSKRYSVDRQKILVSIHYARVLRILRRYQEEIANPLPLKSYASVQRGFWDQKGNTSMDFLEKATGKEEGLLPGELYLKTKKGVAFPHDGLNAPYNYLTQWIGEAAKQLKGLGLESQQYQKAIADIVKIFFRNEGFDQKLPENFEWHYAWGEARKGRTKESNLSLNQPVYPPDNGIAHISYRSIDAMGLLSALKLFPALTPQGYVDYIATAIEKNGVYPFVYEELSPYGKKLSLHPNVALWYLRTNAAYQFQSASFIALFFETQP